MCTNPVKSMYCFTRLNACGLRMLNQIKISMSMYPYFEHLNFDCLFIRY